MTEDDLTRFVQAQSGVYGQVVAELTSGHKRSHWMWFVFPQLQGLGQSATARYYGIRDIAEARRYLAHPILGDRLRGAVRLILEHRHRSALEILGTPDDLKFRSCATLFQEAASTAKDRSLFAEVLERFYDGKADPRTLQLLGSR